jgi:predicted ATPase
MKICRLHVKGYRSLRDIELPALDDVTVIYGENNTGKSNVLAFLQTIFKAKMEPPEELLVSDGSGAGAVPPREARPGTWMRGEIHDFSDNFYRNQSDPILFTVAIELDDEDISQVLGDIDRCALVGKVDVSGILVAEGTIKRQDADTANMAVDSLRWGETTVLTGSRPFPDVEGLPTETQSALQSGLNDFLTDSVVVISSQRVVTRETEQHAAGTEFGPLKLKNPLYNLYMDKESHNVFAEIDDWFNREPFNHGHLTFARTGSPEAENIEIMVEKNGLRLPIERLGSGVQQTLIIIANLVANGSGRVFGLEEPEINLSPASQEIVFGQLMDLVRRRTTHVSQLVLTSHSPVLNKRTKAKVIVFEHDGEQTRVVAPVDTRRAVREHFAPLDSSLCGECFDKVEPLLPGASPTERENFFDAHVCPPCPHETGGSFEDMQKYVASLRRKYKRPVDA